MDQRIFASGAFARASRPCVGGNSADRQTVSQSSGLCCRTEAASTAECRCGTYLSKFRTSPEEFVELQRTPVTTWPPFIVKVDALSLGQNAPEDLAEPAQTIVDSGGFDFSATHVQQLACVIHELLGGVRSGSSTGSLPPRLNPVANLSETGNMILRLGATEPDPLYDGRRFPGGAWKPLKVEKQPSAVVPPLAGTRATRPAANIATAASSS